MTEAAIPVHERCAMSCIVLKQTNTAANVGGLAGATTSPEP
jgi:hypothetical protein